ANEHIEPRDIARCYNCSTSNIEFTIAIGSTSAETVNKTKFKEVLRSKILSPGLVRAREQMAFNRLGRKPPELMWKLCQCCREPRAEARGVKIGSRLFLIGGYQSIDHVLSLIDVFDLDRRR